MPKDCTARKERKPQSFSSLQKEGDPATRGGILTKNKSNFPLYKEGVRLSETRKHNKKEIQKKRRIPVTDVEHPLRGAKRELLPLFWKGSRGGNLQ